MLAANFCASIFPLAPRRVHYVTISVQHNSERNMPPIIHAPPTAKVATEYPIEPIVSSIKAKYNAPIPKEINYIWLGRTFEDFDQIPMQQCAKNNPKYRIRLWLDDFSMLEDEGRWGLPRILPSASLKIYTSDMKKPISSAHISTTFATLVRAQIEFFKVHLKYQLRSHNPTI